MALVTGVTYPNNGDRIKAENYNSPIQAIIAQMNGNIDSANVEAGSLPWEVMGSFTNKIPSSAMQDSGNLEKYLDESQFDYVVSGCVWSGDSYGSTLAASMSAGVVRVNGKRIAVSAVTARAFTASKDTYVDIGVDGVVDYTEVTNNSASPALAADHMRVAIIVSGASNIAASGSVNQGQETKVLPIASSIPYTVTDSLGNLICPRDPDHRVIGYRQIVASFGPTSTSTSDVDVTGLSVPVIVPDGRKVKITFVGSDYEQTGGIGTVYGVLKIKESTTVLKATTVTPATANLPHGFSVAYIGTPTVGSHTYKASVANNSAGPNFTLGASATDPAFVLVELV